MKKVALITNVILLAIVFLACKQNKPEPVVEKYYTHFIRGEFKEVKECVMEEHHSYYDLLEQLIASQEMKEEKPTVKVTNTKCEIEGDTVAVCSCMVQVDDQEPKEQVLQLKKVNKVWLVNQGKEGNMPVSNDEDDAENDVEEAEDMAEEAGE
jgi:hypothetical protein